MKIGMYTDDEILEHLTDGEGRGFLGRSMFDAIVEKINKKEVMYDSLAVDYRLAQEEIERLKKENEYYFKKNNEISTLNTSLRSDRDKYKYIIKDIETYLKGYEYDKLTDDAKIIAKDVSLIIDGIIKVVK